MVFDVVVVMWKNRGGGYGSVDGVVMRWRVDEGTACLAGGVAYGVGEVEGS